MLYIEQGKLDRSEETFRLVSTFQQLLQSFGWDLDAKFRLDTVAFFVNLFPLLRSCWYYTLLHEAFNIALLPVSNGHVDTSG